MSTVKVNNNKSSSFSTDEDKTINIYGNMTPPGLLMQPDLDFQNATATNVDFKLTSNEWKTDVEIYWELYNIDEEETTETGFTNNDLGLRDSEVVSCSVVLGKEYEIRNVYAKGSYNSETLYSTIKDSYYFYLDPNLKDPEVSYRYQIGESNYHTLHFFIENKNDVPVVAHYGLTTYSSQPSFSSDIIIEENSIKELELDGDPHTTYYFHVKFSKPNFNTTSIITSGPHETYSLRTPLGIIPFNYSVIDENTLEFIGQTLRDSDIHQLCIRIDGDDYCSEYSDIEEREQEAKIEVNNLNAAYEYYIEKIFNINPSRLDSLSYGDFYIMTDGSSTLPTPAVYTSATRYPDKIEIKAHNYNYDDYADVITKTWYETQAQQGRIATLGTSSGWHSWYYTFTGLSANTSYSFVVKNFRSHPFYNDSYEDSRDFSTLPNVPTPWVRDVRMSGVDAVLLTVSNENSINFPNLKTYGIVDGALIESIADSSSLQSNAVTYNITPGDTLSISAKNIWNDDPSYFESVTSFNFSAPRADLENPYIYSGYDTISDDSITIRVYNRNDYDYEGGTNYPNVETEVWISNPINTAEQSVTKAAYDTGIYFTFNGLNPGISYTFSAQNKSWNTAYADSEVSTKTKTTLDVFTVTFTDSILGDISTQQVVYGQDASLPSDPDRIDTGYVFDSWIGDYTNITSDIIIEAAWNTTPLPEPSISQLTALDPHSEIKIRIQNNNNNDYPSVETGVDGPGGWFTIGTSSSDSSFYETFTGLIEDTSYEIKAYNRTTVDGYSNSDVVPVNYSTDLMPRVDTPLVTAYSNGTDSVKFRIYNMDLVSATGDYEIYKPFKHNGASGSLIKSGTVNLSGNDYEYIYVYGLDADSQYGIYPFSLSADGYKTSLPASREFVTTDDIAYATQWVYFATESSRPNVDVWAQYEASSIWGGEDYLNYSYPPSNYEVGTKVSVPVAGSSNYYIYEAQ